MSYPHSSYQPQYSFMPYYQATPQQLLVPAKMAGWILMALGAVLVLGASCIGAVLIGLPESEFQQLISQATQQQPELRQYNLTPRLFRIIYGTIMGVLGVYGLICIPLGLLVRRGTMLPIILCLILTALPLLLLGVMGLASLASGIQGMLGFLCVGGIPMLLMIAAISFLIRAAGNVSKIAQAQQQMQMMYQQQVQQYYGQQQPPAQQ